MRIDTPLRFRVASGLIAIVASLGVATVIVSYGNGYYDSGYKLTTRFERSTPGLYPGSTVKSRGINIGKVDSIKLEPDGKALITLFMNPGSKVADTAIASIEPLSVFGPKFIKIDQGEHELTGPFLAKDARIDQTVRPLEFTETLANATTLFSKIDTGELITVLDAIADGLAGMGPQLGATLDNAATLTAAVNRQLPNINQLLTDAAALTSALADRGDELVAIAGDLHQVLPEIANRPDELGNLLDSVTKVSKQVADILGSPAVDPAVSGLSVLIGTLNAQRENIPALLETLNLFFGELADVIRVPNGPDGSTLGTLRGQAGNDLCSIIVGTICPASAAQGPQQ